MADNKLIQHGWDVGAPVPLDIRSLVADAANLLAIPESKRFDGLVVFVADQGVEYRLEGGITNANWVFHNKAEGVFYDNTDTGIVTNEVQDAIDTLYQLIFTSSVYLGLFDPNNAVPPANPTDGTGNTGEFYVVNADGFWNFTTGDQTPDQGGDSVANLITGDKLTYNGNVWQIQPDAQSVISVNGETGVVQLNGVDIPYNNATSGLTATDIQAAIDEVVAGVGNPDTIKGRYISEPALIAAQGSQSANNVYFVQDASGILGYFGWAYVEYLGIPTGNINDYQLVAGEPQAILAQASVRGVYPDLVAMLGDQGNQSVNNIYQVLDASGATNVTSGAAHFVKLATTTGDESDYFVVGRDLESKETVLNTYATTPLAVADQANQIQGGIYYIEKFPATTSGPSYVEYLGTNNADATDYRSLGAINPTFKAVKERFTNIATFLADQPQHNEGDIFFVANTNGDNRIQNNVYAYYEKLASNTGTVTDYQIIGTENGVNVSTGVVNNYGDVAAMIAAQAGQRALEIYRVIDATADPKIRTGEAFYMKLGNGVGAGDIEIDYIIIGSQDMFRSVINTFADLAAAVADQPTNRQKPGYIYYFTDGSALNGVTAGAAYAEYLGTTNGDATDYRAISSATTTFPQSTLATYADIPALLAAQGNQITGGYYRVEDSSADPSSAGLEAVYEKTAFTTGDISDYEPIRRLEKFLLQSVLAEYADVPAMIADQANQAGYDKGIIFVTDASGDPNIASGYAYYEYLGTTTPSIADYRIIGREIAGQSLYDGIDTEANILALTGAQYQNETWFSSDTKKIFKYISFDGGTTYVWQLLSPLVLDTTTQSWELPPTPDGQQQDIGQEAFFVAENAGPAVTALDPKVFLTTGVTGGNQDVKTTILAIAADIDNAALFGINTVDIANGGIGKITIQGTVKDVNTSAWSVGDILYIDPVTPGELTNIQPVVDAWVVGRVLISDATAGLIDVLTYRSVDLSNNINTVGGVGLFLTADVETVNAVDFYQGLIGSAGVVASAVETITADALTAITQKHITPVFLNEEILYQGIQSGQLEWEQNGGTISEVQFTIEVYQADGTTGAVEDAGTGLPAGNLGQPPIFVIVSAIESASDGNRNFAQLSGALANDFILPAGKRLLINTLAEKVTGTGGTRDYDVYFGNTAASFINLSKRLELNDLGDVNITAGPAGQVLIRQANNTWANQTLPTPVGATYSDVAALLAGQGTQVSGVLYAVLDASADPAVTTGYAYYEKLVATTGAIGDYRLLSSQEAIANYDKAILAEYADLATTLAAQATQTSGGIYKITDASAFTGITTGYAYVEYLGTTAGDATDYQIISKEEDLNTQASILATYADLATAVAAQGDQIAQGIYYFTDASGLDNVTSGAAYVEYLGTTNADKTDYRTVNYTPLSKVPNTLFVDAASGNDSTGERENPNKPFLTIQAAITAAVTNDTIIISGGNYIIPTGVKLGLVAKPLVLDFVEGAIVTFNGTANCFEYCRIIGQGEFINTRAANQVIFGPGVNYVQAKEVTINEISTLVINRTEATILTLYLEKLTTLKKTPVRWVNADITTWVTSDEIDFYDCNLNFHVFTQLVDNKVGVNLQENNNLKATRIQGGAQSLVVNKNNSAHVGVISNTWAVGKVTALYIGTITRGNPSVVTVGKVEATGGAFNAAVYVAGGADLTIGEVNADTSNAGIFFAGNARLWGGSKVSVVELNCTKRGVEITPMSNAPAQLPNTIPVTLEVTRIQAGTEGIYFGFQTGNSTKTYWDIRDTTVIADKPFSFSVTKDMLAGVLFSLSNVKLVSTGTQLCMLATLSATAPKAVVVIDCSNVYVNKGISADRILPRGTLYFDRRLKP